MRGDNGNRPIERVVSLNGIAVKVLAVFVLVELALFFLDYFIVFRELADHRSLRDLVDITHEDTIGTWVATTQYLVIATVAGVIALRARDDDDGIWRPLGWAVVAAFFLYMSFDDGSRFHERIGTLFGDLAPAVDNEAVARMAHRVLDLFPSYNWQIAFFPLFGAMGVFLVVFLARELRRPAELTLVLLGLSCWVVAVGLDFVEGTSQGMALLQSLTSAQYRDVEHMIRAVEESIELFGATLMLTALVSHFTRVADGWRLCFSSSVPVARDAASRADVEAGEAPDAAAQDADLIVTGC